MAEVEDEPPSRKARQDAVDRLIEALATGDENRGIEVALHGDEGLQPPPRDLQGHRPIDPHGIDAGFADIALKPKLHAFRKSDDAGRTHRSPHQCDDSGGRCNRPLLELIRSEHTRPTVKDLHDIGAGMKLCD